MVGRFVVAFGLVTLLSGSACVSTIDGSWCAATGDQLSINGPSITLPSKITLTGEHHLHAFSYRPLEAAPEPGTMVYMTLVDSGAMELYHINKGNPGNAETWQRCGETS
jgi:hypothetical protein